MAYNHHRLLHLNMFYEVNIAKGICEHMVAHATISVNPTPNQYSGKQTQPQMPLLYSLRHCLIHYD